MYLQYTKINCGWEKPKGTRSAVSLFLIILTFVLVAAEGHGLRGVHGVEDSSPVAPVTASAAATLHAGRAAGKRVGGRQPGVVKTVDKVVARRVPSICRRRKKKLVSYQQQTQSKAKISSW